MKIEFNLQELFLIYQSVLREIALIEQPTVPYKERMLQYNPEREQERKEKHLESLKDNEGYQHLIKLKDKLESITVHFDICDTE